jgi:hypothetical protein
MLAGSSCLLMEDGQKSLADWIEERREEVDQPFSSQIIEKVVRFVFKHEYFITLMRRGLFLKEYRTMAVYLY